MNWESLALTDQYSAFGKTKTRVYRNGSAEVVLEDTEERRILECPQLPMLLPVLSGPYPRHYEQRPPALETTYRLTVGYPGSFHITDWSSTCPGAVDDLRRYLDRVREYIIRLHNVDSPEWQHPFKEVTCPRRVALLNERLLINLPENASVEPGIPQVGGLMGYRRHHPFVHRARFQAGNRHFYITAEDTELMDDGNLKNYLKNTVTLRNAGSADVLELIPGRHFLVVPYEPQTNKDEICTYCTSYFAHPDGSIFSLQGGVDADLLERVGYRAVWDLLTRILTTVQPGSRELVQGPRQWRVELDSSSKSQLSGQLPPKVIVRLDEGADYQVYRFYRRGTFFGPDNLKLSVYLGRHPSPSLPATDTTEMIAFMDSTFPWMVHDQKQRDGEVLFQREVFVGLDDQEPYYLHAELAYKTWEERAVLHLLMSSMRLDERPSTPLPASNESAYPCCSVDQFLSGFLGRQLRPKEQPQVHDCDVLVELLSRYKLHEVDAELPFEPPSEPSPTGNPQVFKVGKLQGAQLFLDSVTHQVMRVDPSSGLPKQIGLRSDHFLEFLSLYPMLTAVLALPPALQETRLVKARELFKLKIPAEAFPKLRELYPDFLEKVLA